MPKRRLEETEEAAKPPTAKKSCGVDSGGKAATARRVRFSGVTAFLFPRAQGFCAVPSAGGTALGMADRHAAARRLSLAEHRAEKRAELAAKRRAALPLDADDEEEEDDDDEAADDGDETESSEETEPGPAEGRHDERAGSHPPTDDDYSDDELVYFQPLGAKQRVSLLRDSGIQPEIRAEKEACQAIRASRQICGCSCEDGVCEPATCDCALSGIRCQVDRSGFPCACVADGCQNPSGRVEFDPLRVRSHHIHTMLRLRMEEAKGNGEIITPSRHMRFSFEDGSPSSSNRIPTTWDPEQGPSVLESSADSGIDSPLEAPVSLSSLYAHQRRPDAAAANGYHRVDAAEAV